MKIGQEVKGFSVFGILPDVNHQNVYHLAGVNAGNKRPIYATWTVTAPDVNADKLEPERFEVFSDSAKTAVMRRSECVVSLLLRSGTFSLADDYMKSFFASMEGILSA